MTKLYSDFQSEDEGARKAFYTTAFGREMDTQSDKNVIRFRTHVAIIGAGPAGLVLALLLQKEGIDCVIVERQSRAYVEARARAGLIEHRVVNFLRQHGLSEGMDLHGVPHTTCEFRQGGHRYKVPYGDLVGGAHVVYPQQFLVQDLLKLFISRGGTVLFSHPAVKIEGLEGNQPVVTCSMEESSNSSFLLKLECDYVAGCDGFHGLSRKSIPPAHVRTFTKQYGIGWLAILAKVPSSMTKLVYGLHESGFAGQMPRTPQVTRFYLECPPGDKESEWPDDRIWSELRKRLADDNLVNGPIIEKRVLNMRSVVMEPMQYGRLFLAGDAAHIVTPVGAKGMNLAIADAEVLARALVHYYRNGDEMLLREYSSTRLPHVWRTVEFSDWMLRLIHSTANIDTSDSQAFSERLRQTRLERLMGSDTYARLFAESYVGLRQRQSVHQPDCHEVATLL